MQITKRIRLDFARALSPIYVFAKQGDVDSRYVEVEPLENGKAYTIPAGVTAAFACQKPDGHQVLIDGATSENGYPKIDFENNLIILELTDQTLAAAGDAIATAVLKNASTNQVLSTQNFILKIERSALEGASVESADEYQGYISALNLIDEALKKSEDTVKEEEKRAESELERQLNEETRQEAEKERVETFAGWKEQIDGITADNAENRQNIAEMMPQITSNTQGITQNSQLISRNSARLTNLEQRISPSPFVTDSTVAYVKDVPANALPYAELQKLGGMSRKCTNLLPLESGFTFTTQSGNTNAGYKELATGIYLHSGAVTVSFNITQGTSNVRNTPYLIKEGGTRIFFTSAENAFVNAGRHEKNTEIPEDGVYTFGWWDNSNSAAQTISKLMLNEGATALPYEPYFEGLRSAPSTSVESVGANLFDKSKIINATETETGFKFTNTSADGTPYLIGYLKNIAPTLKVGDVIYFYSDNINAWHDYPFLYLNGTAKAWYGTNAHTVSQADLDGEVYAYGLQNKVCEFNNTRITKTENAPYSPYVHNTLPIPEAVQALDGFGEGNPDDPTEYNSIQWDKKGNCSYSHKGNIVNNEWIPLSNEIVTDISALITADNLLPVEGNGTIAFVNEYGYAVPSTVEYMT